MQHLKYLRRKSARYLNYLTTPDRILHHAIINILEPIFISVFTADTYSCIKDRGVHKASYKLRQAIQNEESKYYMQLDVRKFYPSIDHDILKILLRKKFKDLNLLSLLDEIIDSAPGCPVGNYLSQFFANYYLTFFDHYVKETLKIKHYFRYCDDLILIGSKEQLKTAFIEIEKYLRDLKLEIKPNWKLSPIAKYKGDLGSGIDFCGYVHYKECTLIRKSIKTAYIKAVKRKATVVETLAAYNGWLSHADCINLKQKYEIIKN